VTDMSGETRIRERGQLRFTYLFDTLGNDGPDGTPVPGGETIEDLSVKVAGPHAGFEMTEEEWCALQDDMIG
jgi:hypothetical protein